MKTTKEMVSDRAIEIICKANDDLEKYGEITCETKYQIKEIVQHVTTHTKH